ncbi:MAG: 30S ribosomal protein S12 methylthiotransferase RimO [Nitriliruptoraceae bacterium]
MSAATGPLPPAQASASSAQASASSARAPASAADDAPDRDHVARSAPLVSGAPEPRRVSIITLGCGRNEVDTEQLAGLFHRDGAVIVDDPGEADVVLVNTCTFIAPAKQESIDTVLAACQLKDEADPRAVIVVGCMAQRYPDELAEAIPEADAIIGFDGYPGLPAIVEGVLAGRTEERVIGVGAAHPGSRPTRRELPLLLQPPTVEPSVESAGQDAEAVPLIGTGDRTGDLAGIGQDDLDRMPASGPRFPVRRLGVDGVRRPWAYLKIASGCDRLCTFCAIPSFRGRFRSRPLDELVSEARWLAGQGIRELVLVSENTTSWGKDLPGGRDLQPELLAALAAVDGVERIRLMYLQPAELTDALLTAIAEVPEVASYYDLSLQHVSGAVVERMGRSGDATRFGALIERARSLDPQAVFRSNFILGFPGETEQDVARLEAFLTEHRLDWAGFFTFSAEDGTPSATMPDQVPGEVALERLRRVSDLQERLAAAAAARYVGRHLDVLVDEVEDDPSDGVRTIARSYREAPDTDGDITLVASDGTPAAVPAGRILTARVLESVGVDLVAEVDPSAAGGSRG